MSTVGVQGCCVISIFFTPSGAIWERIQEAAARDGGELLEEPCPSQKTPKDAGFLEL